MSRSGERHRGNCFPPGDSRRGKLQFELAEEGEGNPLWLDRQGLPVHLQLQQLEEEMTPAQKEQFKSHAAVATQRVLSQIPPHQLSLRGLDIKEAMPRGGHGDEEFFFKLERFAALFPEEFRTFMSEVLPACDQWSDVEKAAPVTLPHSSVPGSSKGRDYRRTVTCPSPQAHQVPSWQTGEEGEQPGQVEGKLFRVPGLSSRDRDVLDLQFKVGGEDHGVVFVRGLEKYTDSDLPGDVPLSHPFMQSLIFMGGHRSRMLREIAGAELQQAHSFPGACVNRANVLKY